MEYWPRHVTKLSCKDVKDDSYSWKTDCPCCEGTAFSYEMLGPYSCECGNEFMVMVEGWVDEDEPYTCST